MFDARSALRLAGAALAALAAVTGPSAARDGYDRIVVIGDSLSDTGNAGRFTNGRVWVEGVAARFGLELSHSARGGDNHAVGGARVPAATGPSSLRRQADGALAAPARGRVLVIVYGGGNDLLAAAAEQGGPRTVLGAAQALAGIVEDSLRWGAADVLAPNLPDVGMTPAIRSYGPVAARHAAALTDAFNREVDSTLDARGVDPRRVVRLDVRGLAENVLRDPQAAGFANVTEPCSGTSTCAGYLFWDGVHPTEQAHARLADAALRAIEERAGR